MPAAPVSRSSAPDAAHAWSVEEVSRNVHVIRVDLDAYHAAGAQVFSVLLSADRHFDNPHSDRGMQRRHLEEAERTGSPVIDLGDFFDAMQGKSDRRHQKGDLDPALARNDYLDALVEEGAAFLAPFKGTLAVMGEGNHDCVDAETEILTDRGWVKAPDVRGADVIATLNLVEGDVEWHAPWKVHAYPYSGTLHHYTARGHDSMVTPNHRVLYRKQRSTELALKRSEEFAPTSAVRIPISAPSRSGEYADVSDDMLRLIGWIVTDGTYVEGTRPHIYQSKPDKVDQIRALLDRMGATYAEGTRDRDHTEVMGRELKSAPLTSHVFRLHNGLVKRELLRLLPNKLRLPGWMHALSDRQVRVFWEAIVDGDGHRKASGHTTIYGREPILSDLQALFCTHGLRAYLAQDTRGAWLLYVSESDTITVGSSSALYEEVDYEGHVYCVTVPNGTFFARRNGCVFITGNSAIRKHHETDLMNRLIYRLRHEHSAAVFRGGYSGWVQLRFTYASTKRQTLNLFYHHGYGGGGPVTKGVIQTNRRAVYLPDANIVATGHVHESWAVEQPRARISKAGRLYQDVQLHVQVPPYKEEYEDGYGGFHVEKGRPPKPVGATWLDFTRDNRQVYYDTRRAR